MPTTADRMRKAANLMVARGLNVQYAAGWETRSNGYSFNPSAGFIDHHTAATSDIDNVLINGRSDLPGPLCQWALHKDGTWVLIAAGGANHAGASVPGAPTNSTGWGCEATGPIPLDGYGPSAFPNYDEYVTGMACILEAESWGTDKVWGHKESASPEGRKIDPSFSMDSFRSSVGSGGGGGDWFDMASQADLEAAVRKVLGLKSGQNMALSVYGQGDNAQVFARTVNTNDPNSLAAGLGRLKDDVRGVLNEGAGQGTDGTWKATNKAMYDRTGSIINKLNEVLALLNEEETPPAAR